MTAEDLLVDDGGDGQTVEAVREGLPQLDVEPALTWCVCVWGGGTQRKAVNVTVCVYVYTVTGSERMYCTCAFTCSLTLIVEAVDAVDGRTLVVSPQQEEVLRVLDLVGQQETDGFQGLLPSVHVVPQEQVVSLRGEASILKQPKQVCVLPMDVTWGGGSEGLS